MFKSARKTILKFDKVCFGYKPTQSILNDVSFSILENEHVCIVGANGCGKSTLAKLIAGLFKPWSGKIIFNNELIKQSNVSLLKENTGIIFDDPNSQFVSLTVEDEIAFGLENQQKDRSQMRSIVNKTASYVGISDLLKSGTKDLSGGQKQLVAIASVLAMDPQLIIFDEVISMLDNYSKNRIYKIIESLKRHKTIVSITHDMDEAAKADKLIVMSKGTIVAMGKPKDIFNNNKLSALSLDKPFEYKIKNARAIAPKPVNDLGLDDKVITCKDLTIAFGKKHKQTLIDNFNFSFRKNKIYAIIGNSGVGKTTLVSHFNGLNKSDQGDIYVNNIFISHACKKIKDHKLLRKTVGFVFQFPDYQLFKDTVEQDIAFGPINYSVNKKNIHNLVSKYMYLVGLPQSLLHAHPFDLSNGQKRLVAIAGVLACQPDVIVMDEPTAGLDPSGTRIVINIIKKLRKIGKTVIIITHNMDNVLELADEVLVLHNHKLYQSGTPFEIFNNKKLLKEVNLPQPHLLQELNKHKNLIHCQPRTINELAYFLKKGGK